MTGLLRWLLATSIALTVAGHMVAQPPAKVPAKTATKAAQPAPRPAAQDHCQVELVKVEREGVRTTPSQGIENYYAGGNVHVKCRGRNIHMYADSIASYGGNVIQFISQGSRVRYRDSTTALDADAGTYFKDGERFEAQGNAVHQDLKNGSTIKGSQINYLRPIKGVRPDLEVIAYNRPTVTYAVKDSAGTTQAPYTIVGNLVRALGSDAIYAGGAVTIDREDLKGSADSLWLDSGKKQAGQLVGKASLRSQRNQGFVLTGSTIDLGLKQKELASLKAKGPGRLVTSDVTLDGDSVEIQLQFRQVELTKSWGKKQRPTAVSAEYRILGDSLFIDSPNQRLSTVRAFGRAWAGTSAAASTDSGSAGRDWIAGETVIARFIGRDTGNVKRNTIRELEAQQNARSFYQTAPEKGQTKGSVNYTRANQIVVTMRVTADSTNVDRIDAHGNVDGVHLQPAVAKRDTTRRADSSGVKPPVGKRRP